MPPPGQPQPADTSGTRRIKQNIGVVCIPNDPSGIDCYKDPQAKGAIAESEFAAGDGTCQGDSGSSAYEQSSFNAGAPVSLGVLSRGGVDDPNNPTTCVTAIYTRLDKWRDLIVQTAKTAAALGGYPEPSWTAPVASDVDAGPPATDSGRELGAPCKSDSACASHNCLSVPGSSPVSYACTQECDEKTVCPSGFVCKSGDCYAGTAPRVPTTNNAQGTSTTSGCSIGLIDDPTNPMPWRALGAGLMAAMAVVRRRRMARRLL
jgi:hypothetical protein